MAVDEWLRGKPKATLEHRLQAEMFELLGSGGLGLRELHRRLGGEHSILAVNHHLARLRAVDLVRWEDGRYRVPPTQ